MEKVAIIGVDLAKRSFQVRGATAGGDVLFRKKLYRTQVVPFFAQQPNSIFAMRLAQPRMIGDARSGRSTMK